MKRILGYTVAFLAGTMFSGGVALAATNMIQAQKGTSVVELNGSTVASPPKLVYGGTTYVQLYSIQNALQTALGTRPTWNGTTFNILTSTPSTKSVIGVSQLPYTFTAPDGMKLTVNSISADSTGTVINVDIANTGTKTGVDGEFSFDEESNISASGKGVAYVTDWADPQNPNFTEQLQTTFLNLNPGESVTDAITYQALPQGTTQFTWYFGDFSYNTHSITFDLSK